MTVLDHMRERFALFHLAAESQKRGARRVIELRVRDDHVEDRLRILRHRAPHPDGLEQATGGRSDRGGTWILRAGMRQRRVGNRHREWIAQPLPQRDCERQTGKSGPADDNLGPMTLALIHRAFLVNLAAA